MDIERPLALPDDYYLKNFHALASFVIDTYQDILSPAELGWYEQLCRSAESTQRLYIRLITRKGSTFRCSRLKYSEIEDLPLASKSLVAMGLVGDDPPGQLDSLVSFFTKPELARYLDIPCAASTSRAALVSCLLDASEEERIRSVQILQQADNWITILGYQHWIVFNLCFFGNLYQDSSEFVRRDLGALRYEAYRIEPQSRPFKTRCQVNAHLRYYECSALLDTIDTRDAAQLLELVHGLPTAIQDDGHLQRRLDRFRNRIARQLERLEILDEAFALYLLSVHPPARERRVRILILQHRFDEALALSDEMVADPYGETEGQIAQRLRRKVRRLLELPDKAARRYQPDTTRLTLHSKSDRVEHAAQQFYSRLGTCYYVENSLLKGVLGLLIWDVIFAAVPGAFFNPFQAAPSDFYAPSFAELRANLLAERLSLLNDNLRFSACVMDGFANHHGKSNPLVNWDYLSTELLSIALRRIPTDHWRVFFNRMLTDLRENTSGFPDLILFPDEGFYELIEIKGPGDTLQQNQRRWMEYFSAHRIPSRVVNVRWAQSSAVKTEQ